MVIKKVRKGTAHTRSNFCVVMVNGYLYLTLVVCFSVRYKAVWVGSVRPCTIGHLKLV